jgi:uncharacterized protein YcbX
LLVRVAELWRYPVKSLQGERLNEVTVTADGLDGDRRYAIFDLQTGFGLTGRRVPELLFASAALMPDGSPQITLPDGSTVSEDDELSEWLGRPVALRSSQAEAVRRYEDVIDFEREQSSQWRSFDGPGGPFHDSPRARISLVSTTTIGTWDRRRFRPNVLLDGDGEDDLLGSTVSLGTATIELVHKIQRCVMVTRPQPNGIDCDLDVLRTIATDRGARLAVGALVRNPGIVRVGHRLHAQPNSGRHN